MSELTDGVVVLRPSTPDDFAALIATRDDQFRRFMGEGAPDPDPTFCIVVDGDVVGWVDFDRDHREWLDHSQVNIGYALDPAHRGRGLASRAVMLMLHHLAQTTDVQTATLLIDKDNEWSLPIAARCGFTDAGTLGPNGARFFTKPVPPLSYTDGIVTIRPPLVDDAEAHTAAIDDVQIDWLWLEGQREDWESKSEAEQLDHQRRFLERTQAEWGPGPKWWFVVEHGGDYAGHVDCDLTNPYVEAGNANISYSMRADLRGRGHTSRAVRLILRFLAEHTAVRLAVIGVDERNEASLRVARSVGAVETGRYVDDEGHHMVRHELAITR